MMVIHKPPQHPIRPNVALALSALSVTQSFSRTESDCSRFRRLAWRERSLGVKIVWLVRIMALGNIAMPLYVLLQLSGLKPEDSVSALFRQEPA
jgi:hypothetical protein